MTCAPTRQSWNNCGSIKSLKKTMDMFWAERNGHDPGRVFELGFMRQGQ